MKRKFILWIDDIQNWVGINSANLYIVAGNKNIDLIIIPQYNGDNIHQISMMHDFDLILMDFQMKPYNGDKYIDDIRSWEHLDNVPIIFYTTDPNVELNELVKKHKHIHPVNRKDVEDKVKELIF